VEDIVGSPKSPLLLRQSAMRRLAPWRIDTRTGKLILMEGESYPTEPQASESNDACAVKDLPG
jgi:hypothetical protein